MFSWRLIFRFRVVTGMFLFAAGVLALGWSWVLYGVKAPNPAVDVPTPALTRIPAPTITQEPTQALPTPTVTLEPDIPDAPSPGVINIGAYVEVVETGGFGLRMRSQPGLQGETLYFGMDAEVFQIQDGPQQADGFDWWLLVAPFDPQRSGWAVANYLKVVQEP